MPYGSAQVSILLVDYDEGDEKFYGDAQLLQQYLMERLLSFKVVDRDRGKDVLEMTFRNDDYYMIDEPIFSKGQKLLVGWGWAGELKPPRKFVVQKVTGSDVVVVKAHCMLSLLDREGRSRLFENRTDSEIATIIAEENGYIGIYQWIQQTHIRRDVNQGMKSDARFLAKLADRCHFRFYEDASGLHFHEKNTGIDAVYWYEYRTDAGRGDVLSAPQFDINMTHGVSKVKVKFRDPRTKIYSEVFGGPDHTEMNTLGEADEMGNADDPDQGKRADRMTRIDTRYGGVITEEEAQEIADSMYKETAEGKYKMQVQVIGNRLVGAKIVVGWLGISDVLDGLYYVSECEDLIANGTFTQTLKCQKSALNKVKTAGQARLGKKAKPNPNIFDLGETIIEGRIHELKQVLTVTKDPAGNTVPAYTYVDENGDTPGALTTAHPDEYENLNDRILDDLFYKNAQSVQPDSGR